MSDTNKRGDPSDSHPGGPNRVWGVGPSSYGGSSHPLSDGSHRGDRRGSLDFYTGESNDGCGDDRGLSYTVDSWTSDRVVR